jgi:endonuclease YncB( thermonuclease family)
MRWALLSILVAVGGFASAALVVRDAPASAEARAWFRLEGRVVRVVDGDTLDVRITGGARERIRLIGIDTPERGACFANEATSALARVASGRRVVLIGDKTQDRRDRYKRLLAYVQLPNGSDAARTLIAAGYGRVYVYAKAFARLGAYRSAESLAKGASTGLWSFCATGQPPTPPIVTPPPPTPGPTPVSPPPGSTVATTTVATTTTTTTTTTTPAATTTAATTTAAKTTTATTTTTATPPASRGCDASYPDFCIPPPPPDLDCKDISQKNFRVLQPDPHRFDGNKDGRGCE